jgi:hypothetical protein
VGDKVVTLRFALAFAGAALAVTGVAHAQDRATAASEAPWYERFSLQGEQPATSATSGASANWRINGRWGVTVDVPAERPAPLTPLGPRQETAFGAYFQVSPSLSLGGQVGVAEERGVIRPDGKDEEPDAAVRIRSAFRF